MAAEVVLLAGDAHIPHHSIEAVKVFLAAVRNLKPNTVVFLGDMLDCAAFSSFHPTPGMLESAYEDDLNELLAIINQTTEFSKRIVILEGNHEYRIRTRAASCRAFAAIAEMLDPVNWLKRHKPTDACWSFVPYGPQTSFYPHYRLNSRLIAVHGWSHTRAAARRHLELAQGHSVIFGHTHRLEMAATQLWHSDSKVAVAASGGCLCRRVPAYGHGTPVDWVTGFVVAYLGRRSDSVYCVPITKNRAVLPDGTEVTS